MPLEELPRVVPVTARLRIPSDVLVSAFGGEAVLLNLQSECYFGLNAAGARMWTALTTAPTVQAACDELLSHYDVPEDQLERDLAELVEKLLAEGLLEVSDG